jgi:phosphate/phosphite/phosphonate ABC transporters, periplasmic binding protein
MKFKKLMGIVVLLSSMAVVYAGCSNTSASSTDVTAGTQMNNQMSVQSMTETKNEELAGEQGVKEGWPQKITIVQLPDENNPNAGEMHEGFRQAMEDYLGIKVEELEAFEYAVGIEAMRSERLEVMLVTPMSYYQAKNVANIEPLVTTGVNNTLPYKTVFITKSDRDDINSLEDLRGKTFAFVDPASSSGYMYPKAKLVTSLGLEADQLENPNYYFSTVAYSGKHDSSLMGVVMGDYDAAAVALSVIDGLVNAGMVDESDIKIIDETDEIPNACFVIRGNLPQDLKDKIKEFYLQYDDATYFEAFYNDSLARFIEAKDSDYDVVYEMIEILKIEE